MDPQKYPHTIPGGSLPEAPVGLATSNPGRALKPMEVNLIFPRVLLKHLDLEKSNIPCGDPEMGPKTNQRTFDIGPHSPHIAPHDVYMPHAGKRPYRAICPKPRDQTKA